MQPPEGDDLPPPMTPPDCDLRGFEWMPLFGHRLFASDMHASASDAEFRAAVRLWWSAWQQCPAASLPDNDRALAEAAGYGRDMKGWRRVRAVALHGFVLCGDGRLYHPLLADAAVKASERRRQDREQKRRQRDRKREHNAHRDAGAGAGERAPAEAVSARTSAGHPADVLAPVLSERERGEERRYPHPYGMRARRPRRRPILFPMLAPRCGRKGWPVSAA